MDGLISPPMRLCFLLGLCALALASSYVAAQTEEDVFAPEPYAFEEAPPGTVPMQIIVSPPDAAVSVDGQPVGRTDADAEGVLWLNLASGDYRLRAEKEGFLPADTTLTVGSVTEIISIKLLPGVCWLCRAFWALVALCAVTALALALVNRRKAQATARFDRYHILRPLGRGGMATVYLARDRKARHEVALKVMDAELTHDDDLVRKFVKEGEALQRIGGSAPASPVVRAFRYGREHGRAQGRPFVALEYVPGESLLRTLQTQGRLPVTHVLAVARQVAEGLAAAHAHGIWHRDVSPDNVLVAGYDAAGPVVRLIDFGVAKHEYTQAHTLDGSIAGKPAYMSPEQCRGEGLDGRSDLYSLGVMLYTLLAGHPPFTDPNPLLVMRMHETSTPPPLPPDVPPAVAALVLRLLRKRPDERFSSAAALVAALDGLGGSGHPAQPASVPPAPRVPVPPPHTLTP